MIKLLQENEFDLVSGSGLKLKLNKNQYLGRNWQPCMGGDKTLPIACLDADHNIERQWNTKSIECGYWFCCSGEKGNYAFVVINATKPIACDTLTEQQMHPKV